MRPDELQSELESRRFDDVQGVAEAFQELSAKGFLDFPYPGSGSTWERHQLLAEIAANDLSLARLVEGHTDAHAILAELQAPARPGSYGVWAAEPAEASVVAERCQGGYVLRGKKRYASGATSLTRALITARTPRFSLLFDIDLRCDGVRRVPGSWPAVGMAHSDSLDVEFNQMFVPDEQIIGEADADFAEHDPRRIWLATSDADSRVSDDWLVEQLRAANAGAHALAGVVRIDEWGVYTPLEASAFRRFYAAHGSREEHAHVHGANLGIRADAYLDAGGFAALASGEDHALWNALTRRGRQIVATRDVIVVTSSRVCGRAPAGFADFLARQARSIGAP